MALSPYQITIYTKEDNPYNVVPNAPIEIKARLANGTSGGLSTIYEDSAGTIPITQSGATADANGQFVFYAAAAEYNAIYQSQTVPVDTGLTPSTLQAPLSAALINDLSQTYEFATVAAYKAFATAFPVGKVIRLLDRGASFTVISGTGTATGYKIIASTQVSQSIDLIIKSIVTASHFGSTRDSLQSAVDYYSSQSDLESLTVDGIDYGASATAVSIGGTGKNVIFESPTFGFDVEFYRCLSCNYLGHFTTSGDVRNIGLLKSTMPSFDCNFWYLQNYAGWGGVNFATFGTINATSGQVRQAANTGAISSINEVKIDGLYCQNAGDLITPNIWGTTSVNFWIRGGVSNVVGAPVYTEDGTDGALTGLDKWENAITTSPFIIIHGDMSYGDDALETWGIKQESDRPIVLLSDFIEGHNHTTEGNVIRFNAEDRNGTAFNVSGDFDVVTNLSNTQKWGNYKVATQPIYDNYEFKKGLDGVALTFGGTGGGFLPIAGVPAATQSTGDNFIKLVNTGEASGARMSYSFVAQKSGRMQVAIRGINTGQVTIKVGAAATQFALGYPQIDDGTTEAYSVASSNVVAGETIVVTVYTKALSTPDTGETAYITGFGVFYGSHAPTLYQQDLDYDAYEVPAPNGVVTDLFTIADGSFKSNFRHVTVFTHNPVAGGGGEKIVLEIGLASGSSAAAVTVTEVSRTAVNGVGGTSDDSGTLAISTNIVGTSYTVRGTLSGPVSVNVASRVGIPEQA